MLDALHSPSQLSKRHLVHRLSDVMLKSRSMFLRAGVGISLDVLMHSVEFPDGNPYFGKGLIVEVQHRHGKKDPRTTTHDYLSAGFSVVWLSSQDFGEEELDYSIVNEAFASEDGSGYSFRNCSSTRFLDCESYHYTGEHNWGTVPGYVLTCEDDYDICTARGCSLRRQYDEESSEYVYNPESVTTPDLPLSVFRNTIVRGATSMDFERQLTQRYEEAVLEKALADRPEIDECPGPKGIHKWNAPKALWDGYATVELRSCQYCAVHLLSDLRGYEDDRMDIFFSECPDPEWDLLSLTADPRQCQHRSHSEGQWFEVCPDCGVTNPT
ncbi:hypothetical protein GCM10009647_019290 [Streptomyces sanglieri]